MYIETREAAKRFNMRKKMIDEKTLLAYVDGQLDAQQAAEIENALSGDEQARRMVNRLRESSALLPSAFDSVLREEVPPTLVDAIHAYELESKPSRRVPFYYSLAASVLLFVIGIAGGLWGSRYFMETPMMESATKTWIDLVADYQVLYSRDTLHQPDASAEEVRATEERLGQRMGSPVHIPDLSGHGLDFKRGQTLEINEKPLAQLVYLPKSGKPIAYCILQADATDSGMKTGQTSGLNWSSWQRGGYAYIVIGQSDRRLINEIAEYIYATL